MGITNRNFEEALKSTEAACLRGKLGYKKANYMIQEIHNKLYMSKNHRKCGFDLDRDY
ncbi:MAG: hypothetical protein M0R03_20255 [Novosphingobium sp.]|nr:hypothetical protein [Novosphingobium sp.]